MASHPTTSIRAQEPSRVQVASLPLIQMPHPKSLQEPNLDPVVHLEVIHTLNGLLHIQGTNRGLIGCPVLVALQDLLALNKTALGPQGRP